ncbi:MAG: c-type cytochrome biogenesis protein CcsB [Desulfatiglandales bacterium]
MITSSQILSVITFVYFFVFLAYLVNQLVKERLSYIPSILLLLTTLIHGIGILLRWKESYELGYGHAPFSTLYESLIFYSWSISSIYLLLEWRTKSTSLGVLVTPLPFLALAYASFSKMNKGIQPLIPALKSNWLIAHVITCFVGYAAFAISFASCILYLLSKEEKNLTKSLIPSKDVLEEINYNMVVIGFVSLSLGIITGAIWANVAWGSYWSWDPKETWSLITWLVYASVLHARLTRGWRGKKLAILSIIGFCCVIFTYFGVNLLPSLHSYATM